MTSVAFALLSLFVARAPQQGDAPPPPAPPAPQAEPPAKPSPTEPAAAKHAGPSIAPVEVERLVASLQEVPPSSAERVAKLVAMLKSAGGDAAEVEVEPLGESLMARAPRLSDELRERLTKRGAAPAEIQTAIVALNRRLQELDGNVVARLPGRTPRVMAVTAHVDASPGSAGIVDDWTGCALLADLLASCRGATFRHTLWFVAFAKQEDGCLGSAAFADALTPEQREAIDAVVTIDCAGVSTPRLWWSGSERGMAEMAAGVAGSCGVELQVVDFAGGKSDGRRLKGKNLPVVTLLGVEPARFRMLHGPEDRVEAVDRGHFVEMRNLVAGILERCDVTSRPLRWDFVSDKLGIGDAPGMRKALLPVKVDLAAAAAPAPAPAVPPSPRDGSHRP